MKRTTYITEKKVGGSRFEKRGKILQSHGVCIPEGLKPLDHQVVAIDFAMTRNESYLGLDPGLGKTIVAALVSSAIGKPIVYISPPFLVENVINEFKRWAPQLRIFEWDGLGIPFLTADVLIIPDSMLIREDLYGDVQRHIKTTFKGFDATLIVDEAHRFKSSKAQRTRALFGRVSKVEPVPAIVDLFQRKVFMSGTPMPNRPIELYPVLSKLTPKSINYMNEFAFGRKYCAGFKRFGKWDFKGSSNLKELAARVIAPSGKFMLRLKKDVLDLPPLIEEVFVISGGMTPRLAKLDRGIGKAYGSVEDVIKKIISDTHGLKEVADLHTSTYRRLLGLEKIKPATQYLESLMDETNESILVFAYHKDVIDGLAHSLRKFKPFVISGETSKRLRQAQVNEFQTQGNKRRIVIGNIQSLGIGFTLTRAKRVLFVEFSWVPAENRQAADRAHRIGQKESVLVQYMVYKDSLDKAIVESNLHKLRSIDQL